MEIHEAVELIAYFYFDAKIEQGSKFEVEMCEAVIDQIKNKSDISNQNLALCWIYFNAHAREPLGQFIKVRWDSNIIPRFTKTFKYSKNL